MQVEHVARVGLASRRAAQGQRHLAVGHGLLGQVIVDDEHGAALVLGARGLAVLAVVDEVLAHGGAGHRRDVLQRGGVGGGGGHDDGVLHGAMALERLHHAGHRGGLLADGDVDADHVLIFLVDDGVDGDSRLASLAVADDELALAAADRHHGVDGQNTGLHRLVHGLARDNAGSLELHRARALGLDGALAVDGLAQRVHHAAEHGLAGGNLHDTAGRADLVVLLDCGDVTQKHGADLVLFEVLGQAVHGLAALSDELEQLAGHGIAQAVDARNAVADLDDRAHFARLDADVQLLQLLLQRLVDGLCGDFSH